MRTRLSPKNQDRLFGALFRPDRNVSATAIAPICFNCASYPSKRMHAVCRGYLKGQRVSGLARNACFLGRKHSVQENETNEKDGAK